MALKVIWTRRALQGLDDVLQYLDEEWTRQEIINLESKIKRIEKIIVKFPDSFPNINFDLTLRKALVDKNNYLIYRVNLQQGYIEIINFRGTHQRPIY